MGPEREEANRKRAAWEGTNREEEARKANKEGAVRMEVQSMGQGIHVILHNCIQWEQSHSNALLQSSQLKHFREENALNPVVK